MDIKPKYMLVLNISDTETAKIGPFDEETTAKQLGGLAVRSGLAKEVVGTEHLLPVAAFRQAARSAATEVAARELQEQQEAEKVTEKAPEQTKRTGRGRKAA